MSLQVDLCTALVFIFLLFTILKKGGEVRERKGGNEDLFWHLESRLVSEGHSSTLRRKEKL